MRAKTSRRASGEWVGDDDDDDDNEDDDDDHDAAVCIEQ